jgi:hypothetical protein
LHSRQDEAARERAGEDAMLKVRPRLIAALAILALAETDPQGFTGFYK